MLGNQSELASILERIDSENQAAQWALSAPNLGTAKHLFITRRMERMGALHEELEGLVGEQQAMELTVKTMEGGIIQ